MGASAERLPARAFGGGVATGSGTAAAASSLDAWPRTRRPLPWLVAAYLLVVVLLPFDSAQLPIAAPIDTTLDRFAIGGLVLALVLLAGAAVRTGPQWRPLGLIGVSLFVFVIAALASDLVNATRLQYAEEVGLAVRRFAYLLGYAASFAVVAWSVRREDVPGLVKLLIGAAAVCALGIVVQQRMGTNIFFEWTRQTAGGALALDPTPVKKFSWSRPVVTGPTQHGLAAASMLLMIAPFALALAYQAKDLRGRVTYGVLFLVLVLGSVSTLRRTSVLALLAMLLALAVYRHRHVLRLLPYAIPAYLAGQVVAPGVGGNLRGQLLGTNENSEASTEGRASDYAAIVPDVLNRPFLGRGFGTYHLAEYRVLDNQYLLLLLEVGIVGLLCFAFVLGAIAHRAHVLQRARDAAIAWFGVAALAAVAVFAISCALFDIFIFPQPVYVLTCIAGLLVVVGGRDRAGDGEDPPPRTAAR